MSNKRVCVILPCNIYIAPFYHRYEKILNDLKIDFDLIIWNRANILEEANANVISFNKQIISNNGDKKKILNFIKFGEFVKKKIIENKYDKVLILGSYSGTMAYLARFLSKKYKNNYWLDIRDYTYEWFKPYCKAMEYAIRNSYATCISSIGYKKFLPQYEYIISHNIDKKTIKAYENNVNKIVKTNAIRISFIGNVRYFDENIKLLNAFKNDERFTLQYYGSGSERLEQYCRINSISNVDFRGRFTPDDTYKLYQNTDIINNMYGNNGIELRTALSNKLYFSAAFKIPILVSPDTYMSEVVTKYGFGFIVDNYGDKLTNNLYHWYKSITPNNEKVKYNEFFEIVQQEDKLFEDKVYKYLLENN